MRLGKAEARGLSDGTFAGSGISDMAAVLAGGVMGGVGSSAGEYNVMRSKESSDCRQALTPTVSVLPSGRQWS